MEKQFRFFLTYICGLTMFINCSVQPIESDSLLGENGIGVDTLHAQTLKDKKTMRFKLNGCLSYDDIIDFNSLYSSDNNSGTPLPPYNVQAKLRTGVLGVVSAPHATRQWRGGSVKAADQYTGGIVDYVGALKNCSSIAKSCQDGTDPNFDAQSQYRDCLVGLITVNHLKFLIDVHGASEMSDFDLAIGTDDDTSINLNPDIRDIILATAEAYGLIVDYNNLFKASGENTVSKSIARQTGIAAIQVEINSRFRMLGGLPVEERVENYCTLIQFLSELVDNLDAVIPDPVLTTQRRIALSEDDVEQQIKTGLFSITSKELELCQDENSEHDQMVGLRFFDIPIPRGATIINAFVRLTVAQPCGGRACFTIAAHDVDDAQPFDSVTATVSGRKTTTAVKKWSPAKWSRAGTERVTPNLNTIIQSIVYRPGWMRGNSLAIIISGVGNRVARSFDGGAVTAPQLTIEYTHRNSQPGCIQRVMTKNSRGAEDSVP
ncbi:MAG: hypothetical protein JW795_22020 [Chitinivibrionales bacterium]|nr:hypothetical protein [Chitinivibrionales bacterium]